MLNRYDIMKILVTASGYAGRFMVWMGMLAGCILLWYLVFTLIRS
jgi:hypothetical protein